MTDVAPTNDLDLAVSSTWAPLVWAAGIAAAGSAVAFDLLGSTVATLSFLAFTAFLAVMTHIDLRELRIPNALVGPALVLTGPSLLLAATSDIAGTSVQRALYGAGISFAIYFVLLVVAPGSIGGGDVKLAPVIGAHLAFLSWETLLRGTFFAFVFLSVVGIALMVVKRARLKTHLPFGPFMAAGGIAAALITPLGA